MREMTIRVEFTSPSLGNVKPTKNAPPGLLLPRDPSGQVCFMATWHRSNMKLAAQVYGRHQDEVDKILWDAAVDGRPGRELYRRWWGDKGKSRYTMHEAFWPGQTIGVHCVVPAVITDDDLWRLMELAGRFKGLSPFKPGDFGKFLVKSVWLRRRHPQPQPERDETKSGKEEDQLAANELVSKAASAGDRSH